MEHQKTHIVFSDFSRGGVFSASSNLQQAFIKSGLDATLYNLKDKRKTLPRSIVDGLLYIVKNIKRHDSLILMHFDTIFIGIILGIFGYKKIIYVIHTDVVDYYSSARLLKKNIIRILFHFIRKKHCVFVSYEAEQKAKKFFNLQRSYTIYNIYSPLIKISSEVKVFGRLNIGVFSRLHLSKNIDLTIRLVKELKEKYTNLELHIYGKGAEEKKLNNYIQSLGCSDYVFIKGFTEKKDEAFSSIDALICMSSIEGFGLTILESISFKKPVYHTDCSSGPRELISPASNPWIKTKSFEKTNVGYLVRPIVTQTPYSACLTEEERPYLQSLSLFIENLQLSSFNMDYSFSRFSEENVLKQWHEVIALLNKNNS